MLSDEIIIDYQSGAAGKVPVVSWQLDVKDYWGGLKVRLNIARMKYIVEPGLYAIGNPDESSPVLASANYKLSFDSLRKELKGIDAWILALDTKGINVWCAAGKGTFGTNELVSRISSAELEKVVSHRKIIVPQLGAPGVSAHQVKEETGFKVVYGPVRASDLPEFLNINNKASEEMREVNFSFMDRLAVTPVELVQGFKYMIYLSVAFLVLAGLNRRGFSFEQIISNIGPVLFAVGGGYLAGTFFTPLFLPAIPGRAFSLKGVWMGILIFGLAFFLTPFFQMMTFSENSGLGLASLSLSSFYAMNFTGSSTYTSLSGVKKEMKYALPLQITGLIISGIIWIFAQFI